MNILSDFTEQFKYEIVGENERLSEKITRSVKLIRCKCGKQEDVIAQN